MIPSIYRDMYSGSHNSHASKDSAVGIREKTENRIKEYSEYPFIEEATHAYMDIADSLIMNHSDTDLPIAAFDKDMNVYSSTISSVNVFSCIEAMRSLGMTDEASNTLGAARHTDILLYREDGLPIMSMEISGSAKMPYITSSAVLSYISALCSRGLRKSAQDKYAKIKDSVLMTHRDDGLPIRVMDGGGSICHTNGVAHEDVFSDDIFMLISALCSLDMPDKAKAIHEAAKECDIMQARDDGLPVNAIRYPTYKKGRKEVCDLVYSSSLFNYVRALCDLGLHDKALSVYRKTKSSSLFEGCRRVLPAYCMQKEGTPGTVTNNIHASSAFAYINALTKLHKALHPGGDAR